MRRCWPSPQCRPHGRHQAHASPPDLSPNGNITTCQAGVHIQTRVHRNPVWHANHTCLVGSKQICIGLARPGNTQACHLVQHNTHTHMHTSPYTLRIHTVSSVRAVELASPLVAPHDKVASITVYYILHSNKEEGHRVTCTA